MDPTAIFVLLSNLANWGKDIYDNMPVATKQQNAADWGDLFHQLYADLKAARAALTGGTK